MKRAAGTPGVDRSIPLPVVNHRRPSVARPAPGARRMARWRAAAMILVYVLIVAHIVQWRVTGRTLGPFVASDTMETLENGVINAGALIFGAVLLLTLLCGRFLCGWACHMGGLQDLCAWLMRRVGLRPRLFHARLLAWAPIALGFYMFIWPTVRRDVLAPALKAWWPSALPYIGGFHDFPGWSMRLSTTDLWERLPGAAVAIPFLLVCGFACVWFLGARGFCRYGCPYGGIMSPLEQLAPVRVKADLNACDQCGLCTAACTSGVRVMEEVRVYGRVVNRHCTRTLDCVAVCPKGALALGVARPGLLRQAPKTGQVRVLHDLTWPEELLVAGAFLVSFLATRSLYDTIPMLMAIGLGACFAFLCWKTVRVIRDRDTRFIGLQLRRAGRIHAAGAAFVAVGVLASAGVLQSVAVRILIWRAGAIESSVTVSREVVFAGRRDLVPQAMKETAGRAAVLYEAASGWRHGGLGIADTPSADFRAAWLRLVLGQYAEAESLLRRAIDRVGGSDTLAADLAQVMVLQDQSTRATEYLEARLAENPAWSRVRDLLAWLYVSNERIDLATGILERAIARDPGDAHARARLASIYVGTDRHDEALEQLQRAAAAAPRDTGIRRDLAVVRFLTGDLDGALAELERGCEADPVLAPELLRVGGQMLAEHGRHADSRRWADRAAAAQARMPSANPATQGGP